MAERFSSSVHIKVDDIRESMVSGFAPPGEWTPEGVRQFKLARDVAIHWAQTYAAEGSSVVIDDVCIPESFTEHYQTLFGDPEVYRVLLNPGSDALTRRVRERGGPYADFFVEKGIPYVTGLIEAMPKQGWTILDSSDWTVEQTVDEVMAKL